MNLCRMAKVAAALLPIVCAACVSNQGAKPLEDKTLIDPTDGEGSAAMAIVIEKETAQPGTATYNCADGSMMTIHNLGTAIRILGPDGDDEELPAAPANQRSRYGLGVDAVVLDGREALVVKGRHPPLTCTR